MRFQLDFTNIESIRIERDNYSRVSKRGSSFGEELVFWKSTSTFRRNNALFVGKERTRGNWGNVAVTEAREVETEVNVSRTELREKWRVPIHLISLVLEKKCGRRGMLDSRTSFAAKCTALN